MTNREVFAAFARGEEAAAESVRSERVRDGVHALYSYSTPVALNVGGRVAFDERTYSVTTAKHMSQARQACQPLAVGMPHDEFRALAAKLGVDLSGAR